MPCRVRMRGDSGWRSSAIVCFSSAARASFSSVNEMEPGNEGRAPVQLNASRTRARRREHRHPVSLLQLRMSRNYNGGVPQPNGTSAGSCGSLSEQPRRRAGLLRLRLRSPSECSCKNGVARIAEICLQRATLARPFRKFIASIVNLGGWRY